MNTLIRRCMPLFAGLLVAGPAAAGYSSVCIEGIYQGNGSPYACINNEQGFSASAGFAQTSAWGVSGSASGDYRGGAYSTLQAADLATGVMRSTLLYASGPDDRNEYQLGTYLDMSDELTFQGSGSARFVLRLTGSFIGSAHRDYGNTMDTALDFTSSRRGQDVLGRIHLVYRDTASGLASFNAGSNCSGFEGYYGLGSVSCTVRSLDARAIDIDLRVTVDDISDGEVIQFRSVLNVQAYGPRDGGTDFGNTARLGIVDMSPGLGFSANSGVFLAQATPVPEPHSWALLLAGLGAVGLLAARRRA